MKKITLYILLLTSVNIVSQNVGINATNLTPNASAMLDVSSTSKGLLIPRVTLTGTTDATTITTAATSLLVYNTATATDVTPGYYYWNGTTWVRMINAGNSSGGDWSLIGNAGTIAGTNFLGTTDAQDLVFKTNATENMRILNSNGNVGIGTTAPLANLHVVGSVFDVSSTGLQFGKIANGGLTLYRDVSGTFPNDNGFIDFKYLASHQNDVRIRYNYSLGTNGALEFLSNTDGISANSTSKMIIMNTGDVGVGTVTPSARLHSVLTSNATATHVLGITRLGTGAAGNGVFFTHGASISDYNAITGAGDIGLFFDIDGNPAVSNSTRGLVIAPWANGGVPGFGTGIKIQEDGNVGIGTSTPTQKLHILDGNVYVDNSNTFQYSVLTNDGGLELYRSPGGTVPSTNGYIDFKDFASDDNDYRIGWNNSLGTNGGFVFAGNTDGTPLTATTDMVILNASGNVGIGTAAPTRNLHIKDATAPIFKLQEVDATTEWDLVADGTSFSIRRNNLYTEAYPLSIKINKNVGLSTVNPTAVLSVNGGANKPGGGAWAVFSDKTLKKDINDFSLGIETLSKLHLVNFKYNDKYFNLFGESEDVRKSTYQGVIAQELQKIAPFMVDKKIIEILDDKGTVIETENVLEVDPSAFTYMLINATNEQQKIIETQQQTNDLQQKEIEALKIEIQAIKKMISEYEK